MSTSRPLNQIRPALRAFAEEIDRTRGNSDGKLGLNEVENYEYAMGQSAGGPATASIRAEIQNPPPSRAEMKVLELADAFVDAVEKPLRKSLQEILRAVTGSN